MATSGPAVCTEADTASQDPQGSVGWMRIALVSPLIESVPPRFYGGTERVVAYLANSLGALGHRVTVFASGDSTVDAEVVPVCAHALRLDPSCQDALPHLILGIERVLERVENFDIVHFHTDFCHFSAFRRAGVPWLNTVHGRLDLPDLPPLYAAFPDVAVVSISNAQRAPLPNLNWLATVHHGLPRDHLPFTQQPGKYLAFLGRICREKRPDRAIEIARRTGIPLKMAAKVDRVDQAYFEQAIQPLLDPGVVEFIGEIGETDKADFLGNAKALLFPIDWPEPFGLVLIEAMACGTPVVAFRAGSVPEIVEPGRTGYVVDTLDEAVARTLQIDRLDRATVRAEFEARFTSDRMAEDYLSIYAGVITAQHADARRPGTGPCPVPGRMPEGR
mgnify:FL=1